MLTNIDLKLERFAYMRVEFINPNGMLSVNVPRNICYSTNNPSVLQFEQSYSLNFSHTNFGAYCEITCVVLNSVSLECRPLSREDGGRLLKNKNTGWYQARSKGGRAGVGDARPASAHSASERATRIDVTHATKRTTGKFIFHI